MAVKHCSKCNEDNVSSSNICSNCGNSLINAVILGSTEKSEPRCRCPICGDKIKPESRNCPSCGEFISKTSKPKDCGYTRNNMNYNYESGISGGTKSLLYIVTILIPLVGLIIGGICIVSDDYQKRDLGKSLLILGIIISIIAGIIIAIVNNNSYYY